jgi:hypothetical protein
MHGAAFLMNNAETLSEVTKMQDELIGTRFGMLTVLKQDESSNYICQCDCGRTVSVEGRDLLRGHKKSCGCARQKRKAEDITGLRSGKLVALERTSEKRRGVYLWRCRCDCGNELLVEPYKIRKQLTQSCGCARKGHNLKDLTGMRFGKLRAVQRLNEKIGSSYAWLCQCDCGRQIKVSTNALLAEPGTRSCGCGRIEAVKKTTAACGTVIEHCHYVDNTCIERIMPKALQKNNTSGYTGVQVYGNRYRVIIQFKGKVYYLGLYRNIEDAIRVRKQAEDHLFGEFLDWYYTEYPEVKAELQRSEKVQQSD